MSSKPLLLVGLLMASCLIFFGSKLFLLLKDRNDDWKLVEMLEVGIVSYFTEHRKFPRGETGKVDGDFESDAWFNKPLWGDTGEISDPTRSPRGIPYLSCKVSGYRDGALVDSQGNQLRIRIDLNLDGTIHSPENNDPLNDGVLIWSAGRDGDYSTWGDNIKSWD